jgi:hypothetical protein
MPLCPVQIPHELTRARTQVAAVGATECLPELRHGPEQSFVTEPAIPSSEDHLLIRICFIALITSGFEAGRQDK